MSVVFYGFALLLVLILVGTALINARPERIVGSLRAVGPVLLGLAGGVMLLAGRAAIGGMLLSGALAWYGSGRMRRNQSRSQGQRSTVRTAALEMMLDHDTGALEGIVLAGRFENRELGSMSQEELEALHAELDSDGESLRLLETYLDGRFPAWRENAKAGSGGGHAGAQGSGPMTKQEAYEILGLEAGASAADVRKAHRRLIQRLHPDTGGTSFLAARINEAKDVLLSDHG